jgi:nucleotide-binding universal stress UspA family protein
MTSVVLSCIDGSALSTAVCDAGAWASRRLHVPLKLLHVLDKSEYPTAPNLSGNIGLGSREHLLEELIALDEKRGRLALEHGKHLLEEAERRAGADGAEQISTLQRHGSLVETLLEFEEETRLLVMGRLGQNHKSSAHAVGSHLENVVRTVHRPILITVQQFNAPQSFMIAYDGSQTAGKALAMVASSPLLQGLPCHLVMVENETEERQQQLNAAGEKLKAAGFTVTQHLLAGEVQSALHGYQQSNNLDLIVMGAYGHSRIRQFFVGSNTTKMISMSNVPLLLLR